MSIYTKFELVSHPSPQTKVRKGKHAKPPVNPIFAQCAEIMADPYWKSRLEKAAKGKFPSKFSYSNSVLSYTKGNNSRSTRISEDDPFQAANAFCQFLREVGGYYSPDDPVVNYQQEEEAPITWGNSSKKSREVLIGYFYEDAKNFLKLNEVELNQLKNVVRLGLVNKCFGAHNIIITNSRISNILGLNWNGQTRKFSQDPSLVPVESRASRKTQPSGAEIVKDTYPRYAKMYADRLKMLERKKQRLLVAKEIEDFSYRDHNGSYTNHTSAEEHNS